MTESASSNSTVLSAERAEWDQQAGTDKRILLVDQAALFLHFEQTLLQRRGWSFERATTAADALAILENERIDLVIMDYLLPDMAGDELVRRIRGNPRTAQTTAILIVTARGMREHVDACIQAGCNGFLFKPVAKATLCERVQEMLRVPVRRYVRTLVRLQVDARGAGRFLFGRTVNLSASGMLLMTDADLCVGEALDLRFFLPGDPEPIRTRARVVRRADVPDERASACGVVFDDLAQEDQARIDTFVEARTTDSETVAT